MSQEKIVIDGIQIPPGFEMVKDTSMEELYEKGVFPYVRWFKKNYMFLFDPTNAEFNDFLEQCRKDTKLFQAALQKALDEKQVMIWALSNRKPAAKKDYAKISILIRPPLFTSEAEKTEANRTQKRPDESLYFIHVDEKHAVQTIRCIRPKSQAEFLAMMPVDDALHIHKQFIEEHYGDWDAIAQVLVDSIIQDS